MNEDDVVVLVFFEEKDGKEIFDLWILCSLFVYSLLLAVAVFQSTSPFLTLILLFIVSFFDAVQVTSLTVV